MRNIKGYEKLYSVTNDGRIWSHKKKNGRSTREGKFMKLKINNRGYFIVNLMKNGISKTKRVHRLIAEAYIENSYNKPQVNHKNGIKIDNRIENLEWITHIENIKHAINTGLLNSKGSKNTQAKYSDVQVRKVRALFARGFSRKEISFQMNIGLRSVEEICAYRRWKHI